PEHDDRSDAARGERPRQVLSRQVQADGDGPADDDDREDRAEARVDHDVSVDLRAHAFDGVHDWARKLDLLAVTAHTSPPRANRPAVYVPAAASNVTAPSTCTCDERARRMFPSNPSSIRKREPTRSFRRCPRLRALLSRDAGTKPRDCEANRAAGTR